MCGREGPTSKAIVEGSMIAVCSRCSKFGNVIEVSPPIIETREPQKTPLKQKPIIVKKEEPKSITIIVSDCSSRIRAAREKMLLTQEELAKAIAEKESVIQKVESSQFEPPISLARKLELFLKVNLIKELKEDDLDRPKKLDFKYGSMTIGDMIRLRKPRE